jgi:hypothetical protein
MYYRGAKCCRLLNGDIVSKGNTLLYGVYRRINVDGNSADVIGIIRGGDTLREVIIWIHSV